MGMGLPHAITKFLSRKLIFTWFSTFLHNFWATQILELYNISLCLILQAEEEVEEVKSESEEAVLKTAQIKYQEFQQEYKDLLDNSLEEEFAAMKKLGLPTMLVNNYNDVEVSFL